MINGISNKSTPYKIKSNNGFTFAMYPDRNNTSPPQKKWGICESSMISVINMLFSIFLEYQSQNLDQGFIILNS